MRWNGTLFLMLIAALILWVAGCAPASAVLSRANPGGHSQTFIKASYAAVFEAVQNILQNEGYVVEQQDKRSGQIVATIEKPDPSSGERDLSSVAGDASVRSSSSGPRGREGYRVSLTFQPVTETSIKVQLTIQSVELFNEGGRRGSVIVSEESYNAFFDKLHFELERSGPQGRV